MQRTFGVTLCTSTFTTQCDSCLLLQCSLRKPESRITMSNNKGSSKAIYLGSDACNIPSTESTPPLVSLIDTSSGSLYSLIASYLPRPHRVRSQMLVMKGVRHFTTTFKKLFKWKGLPRDSLDPVWRSRAEDVIRPGGPAEKVSSYVVSMVCVLK